MFYIILAKFALMGLFFDLWSSLSLYLGLLDLNWVYTQIGRTMRIGPTWTHLDQNWWDREKPTLCRRGTPGTREPPQPCLVNGQLVELRVCSGESGVNAG